MACNIALIAAVDSNWGIGKDNDMLFYISKDLRRFKQITLGSPVVMGRKTFESLPNGALPKRRNIVITRQKDLMIEGVEIVHSMEDALALLKDEKQAFVIGGGTIYNAFLPLVDRVYLTHIESQKDADVFFPSLDPKIWKEEKMTTFRAENNIPAFKFIDYIRK
ncbi:MAG: dihydrofolate reductase [Prolixibacteraceae bacterium]|jgi:dihydrofolate reductase|nr:dihydrofolate reductase [Prolixibacteraceae bacterium]